VTGTEDDDSELPPKDFGDGSSTLGSCDETLHSNLLRSFGKAIGSAGHPAFFGTLGSGDITVNTDLVDFAGASTDAIQLPEGRFALT